MLKAFARWLLRDEAPPTEKRHSEHYVTLVELERKLEEFEKRTEWELSEWYDKFSTLHARAEKRVQRENKKTGGNGAVRPVTAEPASSLPSVLAHRRAWSP